MKFVFTIVACIAFLNCANTAFGNNNAAFNTRAQSYITTALVNPGNDAMPIQAYMGVPIDSAMLHNMLAGVTTGETNDFEYEQLVRILYFAPGTYDSTILPVLRTVHYWINSGDTLDCYWSENHMAQWMSSHWLLHERYGIPADSNLRARLVHYLNLKIQYGFYEFYSSVYNPYCLAGLLNLADFSQDTVVKNLASQASVVLMKDFMTLTNDKGVFYPTAGRNYSDKYDQPYGQNHNDIIWLLTGFGQVPGGASHGGGFLSTTTVPVNDVIQSWVPLLDTVFIRGHSMAQGYAMNSYLDSVDRIVFQWSAGEYFNPEYAASSFSLISDSNLWHNSVFSVFLPLSTLPVSAIPQISQDLKVASYSSIICSDTLAVFKHNSITLSSVQDFWKGKWGYQQYPCVANVETTAVFTASGVVNSNWADRNATNENDDLPYIKQVKNVALEMYRAESKPALLGGNNPTVSLHWRNNDFTEVRNDSMWLLGRVDQNYVGVRRSCVGQIDSLWACDIPNGQSWVIIVGDSAMYGSFNNFQAVIDSSRFQERWYYDSVAMQEVYYAQIIIDSKDIEYAWGVDSALNTGIADVRPVDAMFSVYPNPANTSLNIDLGQAVSEAKIEVYNALGDMVFTMGLKEQSARIQTSEWSDGLYAFKITNGSQVSAKTIVISH